MTATGRILYVVAFDAIEAAVTWQVAEFSKAWQRPVVLLAVVRRRWLWGLGGDPKPELKRQLSEVAERLQGLKGRVAGLKVAEGEVAAETMRVARNVGAELIMIGAGERALHELSRISAEALKLARLAHEDVWICKPHTDPHIDHVLCAADTTVTAGAAVRRSVDICRRFNARLRILSVMPEPPLSPSADDPEEDMHERRDAQKAFLDQLDLQGVSLSRSIVWAAQPAAEVLQEAERYWDGLLVIGASSQSHPVRGKLGPTSEAIVRACPSSLLIVRKRARENSGKTAQAANPQTQDAGSAGAHREALEA